MTPQDLAEDTYSRFLKGWMDLTAFRTVGDIGIPGSVETLEKQIHVRLEEFRTKKVWPYQNMALQEPLKYAKQWTNDIILSAHAAVDAASLVFAHSIVDAAALGFLRVTAILSPKDWAKYAGERTLRIKHLEEQGYENLLNRVAAKECEAMDRTTSMPDKVHRLMELCGTEDPSGVWKDQYKGSLERIDGMRHEVVHGDLFGKRIETIDADLNLMQALGDFMRLIVWDRYSEAVIGWGDEVPPF